MTTPLSFGYSPCPNDTYIFYALTHNKIALKGLELQSPLLEDVETLNIWAINQKLDITKLSFHALGHVLDEYCVLSAGSALGRGCGPLLVAKPGFDPASLKNAKIAIPGRLTTANLLFRMYAPAAANLLELRFDAIMDAVINADVDAGVIIHESRFTYAEQGLVCLQDLGQWWEETSGHPIPLGCIAAKRSLGKERIEQIDRAIHDSIVWADEHPNECLPYIQQYAQEMDKEVMQSHIELYVNDHSKDLGSEGLAAIESFLRLGREAGIFPDSFKQLRLQV
ncbi:MAG: 1,4-dihydroxy-6-naphthoate synthase [Desulfocapsa sp.]|nr:1,4-dihydroxy-6-naphthoate synthase [Desulfocapsa sp.]MBN4048926.1 1,4-dihydroxy-6-naphthoate synthase [bacterium AH-315-N22]MBN4059925.1 1,4-dihydroxy-6-naphthoate synthase [Desulfotalea psychrophila]